MEIKTSAIRLFSINKKEFNSLLCFRPLNYVSFPMNCLYLFEDRYNVVYLRGRLALVKLVSSINVEEDAYTCVARGELDQLARLVENEKFASFEDFLAKFFNGEKDLTKIIKKYSWEEFHYDPESDMLILLMSLGEFRERLKFEISKKDYLFDLIDTYSRKIINTPWNDDNRQATVIKESKRKLDKANIKPIKKKRLSSSSSDDCPIVQTEKTSKIHGIFNSLIQLEEEEKLKSVDNLEASAVDKPNDNGENTIRNIKRCMVQDDPSPNDDLLQKGIANMSINQVSEKDMSTDFPSSQLDPEIAISRTYNTIFDKLDEYMINNPATNSISDPTISTISRIEEQEIIEKEALKVDDVQDAVDRKPPVYPPVTNVNLPEDIDPIYNHAFESNIYDNVFV